MWIQVRSMDGKKNVRLDGLSKLSKIEDIRELLVDGFDAPPERQRLYFRGKQLVDGHTLFDYSVGLNEIIQILVRAPMPAEPMKETEKTEADSGNKENEEPNKEQPANTSVAVTESQDSGFRDDLNNLYKIGDIIDCRDETMGAWFEAKILSMRSKEKTGKKDTSDDVEMCEDKTDVKSGTDSNANVIDKEETKSTSTKCPWDTDFAQEDECLYKIIYEGYEEDDPIEVTACHLRPRARHIIKFTDLLVGAKVMVNYNYDDPEERGYWYDGIVTEKRNTRTIKEVYCTVFIGKDLVPFENCLIPWRDEIFEIERPGEQLNVDDPDAGAQSPVKRTNKPNCDFCRDNPRKKCKECACHSCGGKNEPDKTLLCDECDMAYHLFCLNPPLDSIPDVDEWYCPLCKNDASEVVQAGEKLKASKKKAKMASNVNQSNRDWGRGMACVGRSKVCSLVPPNHFGEIPGVPVGSLWKFRVGVSESGVHRPHVAGIAGRENEGAYSIVLSGGYEDDVDDGEEFLYTGSGGRDLSGNKRTAEQSCDQTLTRMNSALAKCCNCQVNSKTGGDAGDKWRGGKPIRVVRNCKGAKHSKYAPQEGNRYDGIYKMVKYWPEKGQSGFLVWRYKLRRDDKTPAPWTKEGKKLIKQLGIEMVYPDGWLEAQAEKERKKEEESEKATPKGGKGKGKRKRIESDDEEVAEADSPTCSPVKKRAAYALEDDVETLIKNDTANSKLWEEALKSTKDGAQKFVAVVEETFSCICCQDIVFKPITTPCSHNVCKSCLSRSFKAGVYTCPACRYELGEDYKMETNSTLFSALKQLFPGYVNGRD